MKRIASYVDTARYGIHKLPQRIVMKLAWALPKKLTYWAAIRVIANATTGRHEGQVVPELGAMEALKRWEDDQLKGRS